MRPEVEYVAESGNKTCRGIIDLEEIDSVQENRSGGMDNTQGYYSISSHPCASPSIWNSMNSRSNVQAEHSDSPNYHHEKRSFHNLPE